MPRRFERSPGTLLTPAQCRMARVGLRITIAEMSTSSLVAAATIFKFENGYEIKPLLQYALRMTFERWGVVFTENGLEVGQVQAVHPTRAPAGADLAQPKTDRTSEPAETPIETGSSVARTIPIDATAGDLRMLPIAKASKMLGVSVAALKRWQSMGVGPRTTLLDEQHVGYKVADLHDWTANRDLDDALISGGLPYSLTKAEIDARTAMGKRIAAKRRALNLNQVELAARLGLNQTTISVWERGDRVPPPARIIALAKVLKTTVSWLTADLGSKKSVSKMRIPVITGE